MEILPRSPKDRPDIVVQGDYRVGGVFYLEPTPRG